MGTIFQAYGVPDDNVVATEALAQMQRLVQLSDIANAVTVLHLPETCRAVRLRSFGATVLYNLGTQPDPPLAPFTDLVVQSTDFLVGGVLMPDTWQQVRLPTIDPTTLYLLSPGGGPLVYVVPLVESV